MTISTLDELVAAMLPPEPFYKAGVAAEAVGYMTSTIYAAGRPGAGVAPTPGLAGAALTSYAGQLPFPAASVGKNIHLAGLSGVTGDTRVAGTFLMDRLWHNSGINSTSTGVQTVNSVAFPARDADGSANGRGVQIAIEASAQTGQGADTLITITYTNDEGASGRSATMWLPPTMALGTFMPVWLQAGDKGVRSVQSLQLAASLAGGTIHLVAFRQIALVPLVTGGGAASAIDLGMPRMFDNSVPFLVHMANASSMGAILGQLTYAQG